MNSENDLAVVVCKNYSWEPMRCYAISVALSGFKGTKVIFADGLNYEAKTRAGRMGFKIVDFVTEPSTGGFFSMRYKPVADFLKDRLSEFRNVIVTDVRDVVFQNDPSLWLEKEPAKLVVCSEGVALRREPVNTMWLMNATNGSPNVDLAEEQLCSGTIAGEAEAMMHLCEAIWRKSREIQYWDSNTGAGSDQGLLNHLVRQEPFKEITRVVKANEPFALQANWFQLNMYREAWTSVPPRFDLGSGMAFTASGEPYSIVHQYDRDASGWLGNFSAAVERHYMSRELEVPILESFVPPVRRLVRPIRNP